MNPTPFKQLEEEAGKNADPSLDVALLLTSLRRLIREWRQRASAAPDREAQVYRQAEVDLSTAIANHSDVSSVWSAARSDLVSAIITALDERERGRS